MDDIRDDLRHNGVAAVAIQHTATHSAAQTILQSPDIRSEPLVIVGHSLGADEAVGLCQELAAAKCPVDLMITLDPVYAGSVPENVRMAINIYRSNGVLDFIPLFRGVPLASKSGHAVYNIDVNRQTRFIEPGTNHFTIDTNSKLRHAIVNQILSICPMEGATSSRPAQMAADRPATRPQSSSQEIQ